MEPVPPAAAVSPTQLSARCFAGLRLARYAIELRAVEAARLPAFSGTTLRGAFGYALKRAVCVMPHRDCAKCLLADRCTYPFVFETAPAAGSKLESQQNAPHPFALEPPIEDKGTRGQGEGPGESRSSPRILAPGDAIAFGLSLYGRAIESLPYIVFAIHGMAENGLGAGRARFDLTRVESLDPDGARHSHYDPKSGRLDSLHATGAGLDQWVEARLAAMPFKPETLALRFRTPARIKSDDQLQPRPSFDLLVRNLLRRVSMLAELYGETPLDLDYGGLLARAATVTVRSSALHWWDVERYSTRQQTAMRMGGFVGTIEFAGAAIGGFLPLFAAGELLGIGKGTGFGLGRFELVAQTVEFAPRNDPGECGSG
jgi:hypothetical protein